MRLPVTPEGRRPAL